MNPGSVRYRRKWTVIVFWDWPISPTTYPCPARRDEEIRRSRILRRRRGNSLQPSLGARRREQEAQAHGGHHRVSFKLHTDPFWQAAFCLAHARRCPTGSMIAVMTLWFAIRRLARLTAHPAFSDNCDEWECPAVFDLTSGNKNIDRFRSSRFEFGRWRQSRWVFPNPPSLEKTTPQGR